MAKKVRTSQASKNYQNGIFPRDYLNKELPKKLQHPANYSTRCLEENPEQEKLARQRLQNIVMKKHPFL